MNNEMNRATWRRSSRSPNNANCVEVAVLSERIAVRDSKDLGGPILLFEAGDWEAFVAHARDGGYDLI